MANAAFSTSAETQNEDTSTASASTYFSRRLTLNDASKQGKRVDEAELLALAGNKIILGEPGMGKSALMCELGRRLDVQPITAIRFINARNPAKLVPADKPVLIDGLDEAMARRESDAVDAILAQLEEADSPPFILSCRSREWQSRSATNLAQLYGTEPCILTLEPFDEVEARAYLVARHSCVDADHVLAHLAAHSLQDLYRNPLTLGLMGQMAEAGTQLPGTRAALFEGVCKLIWPEHDSGRQDEGLAQLSEEEALNAAGAIAAALLFAGAEAASAAGAAQVQEGDLRLADLETLPAAEAVRAIFSSKLFHSVGPLRAKPIHRVIAEYLGARWLARQASTPRTQRRILAQLHIDGSGVPASLRGLHAWLAYHSPTMAEQVIAADPYGVLRYGETAALPSHLADRLFEALCMLAKDDPYFRAADWDTKTAAGLMIPEFKPKIDSIIASAMSNSHLRSLLIEGLEGTPLAAELTDTLEAIVLSAERFYRERKDAAKALLPHRDRSWWQETIATLTDQGGDDAPRLALKLIEDIDVDVPDELLVATLFAEIGMTSCPLPRRRHVYAVRSFDPLLDAIQPERLPAVLDLIADYAELLRDDDWDNVKEVADITAHLIIRAIDEQVVEPAHARSVWHWLGAIQQAHHYHGEMHQRLAERLASHDALRRAIQRHVLTNERPQDSLWATESYLQRRLVGLTGRPGDIACMLHRLARGDTKDPCLRQDWQDLMHIGCGPDGLDADVHAAAERFRRGDKALADFLRKLENPKKPAWKVRQEKNAAKRARKRKIAFEYERRALKKNRESLRAGELSAILRCAQAYLGRYRDLPNELPPDERLAEWIGSDLRDDALVGFEAVLHRTDLPSAAKIADGFARNKIYNYSFPIMAGLYERIRQGKGLADLPEQVKQAALLLVYHGFAWSIDTEQEALRQALEAELISTPEARQAFARLWIEPALAAGNEHVAGLHKLAHDPEWQSTGSALGAGWLLAFPDVPDSTEATLVDCLSYSHALEALREVAEARAKTTFRDANNALLWVAIDVLVRFDVIRANLCGISEKHPEFIWFLRDRLQLNRSGRMLPLTVAQAEWIITEFRERWPYAELQGSCSGDTNDHDATDFLHSLISRIANNTSVEASEAMARLVAGPNDSYSHALPPCMTRGQWDQQLTDTLVFFLPAAPSKCYIWEAMEKVKGTNHPRLYRRAGTYYHRAAVPVDIRDTYHKREETFSLKTSDYQEALRRVRKAAAEVDQKFEAHRRWLSAQAKPLDALTADQIEHLAARYYASLLEEDEETRALGYYAEGYGEAGTLEWEQRDFDEDAETVDALAAATRIQYARGQVDAFFEGEAEEILAWEGVGITLTKDSPSWRLLARALQEAHIQALQAKQARNMGEVVPTPQAPTHVPGSRSIQPQGTGPLLSVLVEEWAAEKSRGWREKTAHSYRVSLGHFIDLPPLGLPAISSKVCGLQV